MSAFSTSSESLGLVASAWRPSSSVHPILYLVFAVVVFYPILCRSLRFRRIRQMEAKYKYGTLEHPSYTGMTDNEAQEIIRSISKLEFPAIFEKSLQFALFRTYGISTIAALLMKTKQLTSNQGVARRYTDTSVLLTEIYTNIPNDERSLDAFARMNYIHSLYIRQGKISNDDLLYTLSLFMNQPRLWINQYEWRKLTTLELCALGTFHKSMGDAMQISYETLPGYQNGWKDGLEFFHELDSWSTQYEKRSMLPNSDSNMTALRTTAHFLRPFPSFTKGFLSKLVTATMDNRLRESIMYSQVSPLLPKALNGVLSGRAWLLKNLALPRPEFLATAIISPRPRPGERRYSIKLDTVPVYVKPTLANRYGLGAVMKRLIGVPLPGDQGTYPEGYLIEELGPLTLVGKGRAEMEEHKTRLRKERTGSCPFLKK